MRLTTEIFAAWLQSVIDQDNDSDFGEDAFGVTPLGTNPVPHPKFTVFYGRQPDQNDRCCTIFKMGPGRDKLDGSFEQIPFRLLTRGRSNSLADAENLALYLDDLLFRARNLMVGPIYVTELSVTNKPTQLPLVDKQSRYQFMADYVLLASRYN